MASATVVHTTVVNTTVVDTTVIDKQQTKKAGVLGPCPLARTAPSYGVDSFCSWRNSSARCSFVSFLMSGIFSRGPEALEAAIRAHRDDPTLVERFEVVANGSELANAYSELNDPIDQRTRFEAEARARAAGDAEAGTVDEDYLRALEFALPPTGGMGLGVDRLTMLLAGVTSIREVILFPTLKPEA